MSQGKLNEEIPNILGLDYFAKCFFELNTCRNNGPIPFTSIVEFANIKDIEEVMPFNDFLYVMRQMDGVYLDHLESERKKQSKQNNAKVGNGNSNSQYNHKGNRR